MRILLIEDDSRLSKIITKFLSKELYVCSLARALESADMKLENSTSFDLIILDLILPDGNGLDYCRKLRENNLDTPILVLTSKSTTADKVDGLDAGADDYLPKPFSPTELLARIRALLRRPKSVLGETISCGDAALNVLSHTVKKGDQQIQLMPKEFSLLEYLIRKQNQIIKKEELLRHVWGVYSKTSSNRLEVYIRYLREKLDIPFGCNKILTVRG